MAIRDVAEADPLVLAQERLDNFSPVVFQAMWNTMHEALAHARESLAHAQVHIAELKTQKKSRSRASALEPATPARVKELETRVTELEKELESEQQAVEELRNEVEEEQHLFQSALASVREQVRDLQKLMLLVVGNEAYEDSIDVHNLRRAVEDLLEYEGEDV